MYSSPEARDDEITDGATFPASALRHLDDQALVSLDVAWWDTPPRRRGNTRCGPRRAERCR